MSRKVLSVLLLSMFVVSLAQAGDGWRNPKKVRVAPSNELEATYKVPEVLPPTPTPSPAFTPVQGDTVGKTDYDYGWNSGTRTMVDTYYPGQPAGSRAQITIMTRNTLLSGNAARRAQSYVFYNGTNYIGPVAAVSRDVAATGFGDISIFRSSQADGIAAIPSHTVPRLSINSGPGDTSWTVGAIALPRPLGGGPGDPVSAVRGRSDTLFVVMSGADRTDYWVTRTTDFGVSWRFMDSLAKYAGTGWAADVTLDPSFQVAPNGNLYVFGGANPVAGGGNHLPPVGTGTPANADRMGYWRSTNQGATWTWNSVILDGQNPLASKPREFYIPENFGQCDGIVDAQGTVHMVFNGYGFDFARPDSAEIFRVLYWNSASNTFKYLDRDTLNRPPYVTTDWYSGNAIGRPYPTIAFDPASRSLVAAWSEPQTSAANPVDTSNSVYNYDIWYSYSNDGGNSWSTPTNLTNTPNRTELFAALGKEITQPTSSSRRGHLMYFSEARANAGCFVFAEGPRSDSPWMYKYIDFTGGAVGDREGVPSGFALDQNYPNPFNPSTRISFTVPTMSEVSLRVYDVLGREVANLTNDVKAAGSYDVLFNAANLSSGVYYYTLRSGSFAETRKMVLMK